MNRIKTIIAALAMLICIASCTPSINSSKYECVDAVEVDGKQDWHYNVVELTVNGETHQYIKYTDYNWFGLSHWEGCKYCKEQDKDVWR